MPYPTFMYHLIFLIAAILALFASDIPKEYEKKFLLVYTIFLIIIGGLRGDFTADYSNYSRGYEMIANNNIDFLFLLPKEKGFLLLNYFMSRVFSSPVPFFIVCMAIVLMPVYYLASKSLNPFLFFMVYLCFGMMFDSYNVMRTMMAASLFLLTFKWLKEGKFFLYVVFVLLIATIHKTALFMLPFYFILRQNFFDKKIILNVALGIFFCFFIKEIFDYSDSFFYEGRYSSKNVRQIGSASFVSIIVPLCLCFTVFFLYFFKEGCMIINYCKNNLIETNIILNSTLFCTFLFLSTQVFPIFERFTYFMFPFVMYGLINNVMLCSKNRRLFIIWGVICTCFLYYFIWGQYFHEYFFFWQTSSI